MIYNEQSCLMFDLYVQLCIKCNCYLPFVEIMAGYTAYNNFPNCTPCSFSSQALCAVPTLQEYSWSDRKKCPIACESEQFRQTSIQVKIELLRMLTQHC